MSTVRAAMNASTASVIADAHAEQAAAQDIERVFVSLMVNGQTCTMNVEPRMTLL
jgi:hypothetical protein